MPQIDSTLDLRRHKKLFHWTSLTMALVQSIWRSIPPSPTSYWLCHMLEKPLSCNLIQISLVAQTHDKKRMQLWNKGIETGLNPITYISVPCHKLLDLHVHSPLSTTISLVVNFGYIIHQNVLIPHGHATLTLPIGLD